MYGIMAALEALPCFKVLFARAVVFSFAYVGPLSGRIFARHLMQWKNSFDV
jgi:hypothetical protein